MSNKSRRASLKAVKSTWTPARQEYWVKRLMDSGVTIEQLQMIKEMVREMVTS